MHRPDERTRACLQRWLWAALLSSPQSRAALTCSCQEPQKCSSPTATAGATRERRLWEALCHLGRQVLGRVLQTFAREAI